MSKEFLYYHGVLGTLWKSEMLEKLNPLRDALGLELRNVPLTQV